MGIIIILCIIQHNEGKLFPRDECQNKHNNINTKTISWAKEDRGRGKGKGLD